VAVIGPNAAIARLGGYSAPPRQSVTLLEGWSIVEANDIADLGKLFQSWTDLNVNHITPVFDEDAAHRFLSANKK
jgi:hypothetical protein